MSDLLNTSPLGGGGHFRSIFQLGATIGPNFLEYKLGSTRSRKAVMNFLQLAGLDMHRDVPLEEISARRAKVVEAYLVAKMESDKSGKKLPKRFSDYGDNLSHTDNVRSLMAFLRQAARQANAAILCKKMGYAKDGRFTTRSTYRLLVQVN